MGEIARLANMASRNREDIDLTALSIRNAERAEIKAGRGRGEAIKRLRWARHSLARAIAKVDEAVQFLTEASK